MTLLKAFLELTPSLKPTGNSSKKKKKQKIEKKEAIYDFLVLVSWLTCISFLLIKCKQSIAGKMVK